MGEVSQAEIVDICNTFLLNAPPGEFMEVVTDVRGLLRNDAILNDTAPNTFQKWNTDQMLQVANGNHEALITPYNAVSFNEYLDPRGNCVIQFDHIRQEMTGTRPMAGELDGQIEPYRSAIDDAMANFCAEHYENGASAAYSSREQDGSFNVTVCLSSSKFNPNNFWNGRWRSVYSVIFKPNGPATINGYLRINVHYYEDGNVQLVAEANKRAQSNGGDPARMAADVTKIIAKIEQDYHTAIENSYATMGDTTFKALRRVLPITRQKIDWNKIKNYKIGNDAAANAR